MQSPEMKTEEKSHSNRTLLKRYSTCAGVIDEVDNANQVDKMAKLKEQHDALMAWDRKKYGDDFDYDDLGISYDDSVPHTYVTPVNNPSKKLTPLSRSPSVVRDERGDTLIVSNAVHFSLLEIAHYSTPSPQIETFPLSELLSNIEMDPNYEKKLMRNESGSIRYVIVNMLI
jgi:hypothetical protein